MKGVSKNNMIMAVLLLAQTGLIGFRSVSADDSAQASKRGLLA